MSYVRKVVQQLPGGRTRTYYQGVGDIPVDKSAGILTKPLHRWGRGRLSTMMGIREDSQAPRTRSAFGGWADWVGMQAGAAATPGTTSALPPCSTAQVGQQCASDATPADIAVMDQLQQAMNPTHVDSVYNPSLPPCSSAQPGQPCNSVTAGEAAQLVAQGAQWRTYLIYGGAAVAAWWLFSGKRKKAR